MGKSPQWKKILPGNGITSQGRKEETGKGGK